MKDYPNFISFLVSEIPWLNQLNTKRTVLIHKGILNRSGEYIVTFKWTNNMDQIEDPEIVLPDIPIFQHPIPEWIDYQINKIDSVLKRTLDLRKDIFEYQSTLSKRKSKYF